MASKSSIPKWHSRGYLPHFEGGSILQIVTFHLAGSLPQEVLDRLENELATTPPKEAATQRRRQVEAYLDSGRGNTWLRDSRIARVVENAFLRFDGTRYHLHAWVVMPNHVHVLFSPMENFALTMILHSWKSFTAKEAGRILGRSGRFWQEEYFDRYIRSEEHYWAAVDYIELNLVKADLCGRKQDWKFSSAARRHQDSAGKT